MSLYLDGSLDECSCWVPVVAWCFSESRSAMVGQCAALEDACHGLPQPREAHAGDADKVTTLGGNYLDAYRRRLLMKCSQWAFIRMKAQDHLHAGSRADRRTSFRTLHRNRERGIEGSHRTWHANLLGSPLLVGMVGFDAYRLFSQEDFQYWFFRDDNVRDSGTRGGGGRFASSGAS